MTRIPSRPPAGPDGAAAPGWRRRDWLVAAPLVLPALREARAADAGDAWSGLQWVQGEPVVPGQGLPMVLVFWATWCGYCRRHNVRMDRLHALVRGRMHVVGIAVESEPEVVRRHLRDSGLRFPVAVDTGPLRRQFTERRMVPMTCPVDRQGRRGLCIPGEMSEDDVLDLARLALPARG